MATKKEQARAELMKLPLVQPVTIKVGMRHFEKVTACRINGSMFIQTLGMFPQDYLNNVNEASAIPLRTGKGPFTWFVAVPAISRIHEKKQYSYSDEFRNTLRDRLDTLITYEGQLPELTITADDFAEARRHVAERNRLLLESKQEQNDSIASVVGRADGEPLDKYGYELSNGTLKKLERAGITTVEQLLAWSRLDLLKIGGFGRKALTEVDDMMEAHGWQFGNGKPSDNDTDEKPLTVTLTHKPGDMITWHEWTKADGFGKEHQTKIEEVTLNVYWDETRQQYSQTEKYLTSMIADGKRVSVMVDLMSENVLIGCLDVLDI